MKKKLKIVLNKDRTTPDILINHKGRWMVKDGEDQKPDYNDKFEKFRLNVSDAQTMTEFL